MSTGSDPRGWADRSHQRRTDSPIRLELRLHPGGDGPSTGDPSASTVLPFPVHRRVCSGRRVLLTIPAASGADAVAWASGLRESDRIDGFALAPATLEDTHLALTGPTTTAPTGSAAEEPSDV